MPTITDKLTRDATHVPTLSACLFCCSLCLATGVTASQANVGAVRQASSHARTAEGNVQPERQLVAELWSDRISAPDPNEDAQTRLALKRLIRQVRSVKFDAKSAAPAPTFPSESGAAVTAKMEPVAQSPETPAESGSRAPHPPSGPKPLQVLLQDPNRVNDVFEMAELLYLSGRPREAAPFYQKALDRLGPDDPTTDADRAWVLFQLGNCLRESDMTKAQDAYARLVAKYPDSPWTEMAKAHARLLSWYQTTQPRQLIASEKL